MSTVAPFAIWTPPPSPPDAAVVEEAVTTRVLRLLRVELKPMEESLLAAGTTDPEAYSFFLKGQGHMMEYHDLDSIAAAAEMFEAALAIVSQGVV